MMIGMFGCFSREALQIEIVVQRAEAGRRQLDLADAAERMALERVVVANVGVLLGLVAPERFTSLAWAILILSVSVSNTWLSISSMSSMLCVSK